MLAGNLGSSLPHKRTHTTIGLFDLITLNASKMMNLMVSGSWGMATSMYMEGGREGKERII
jgi:hypothetical protein